MNKRTRQGIWRVTIAIWMGIGGAFAVHFGVLSGASEVPPGGIDWPQLALILVTDGLDQPSHITHPDDGSGRLFVVERTGRIRVINDGGLAEKPFLDISDRVSIGREQGLLSVAFPPDYANKRHLYAYYTDQSGDTVVARYTIIGDPARTDPGSEKVVLTVEQPGPLHNGGQLAFGPDGYLYVGLGDGGHGVYRAQDAQSLLGKLLRIDVESEMEPYSVPSSNPFTRTSEYRDEIWALGLRNPWRFSFDRQTDDLYIGDVGQNGYEEVDFQPASSAGGQNYGWPIMEGNHCYRPDDGCDETGLILPVSEYEHGEDNCAITGGFVYRGSKYPSLEGIYLFADHCSGRIWRLVRDGDEWQSAVLHRTPFEIASFGQDEAGNLYVTDFSNGAIYEIVTVCDQDTPKPLYIPLVIR